ncbi:MAG: cell wall hydrolase, partial [Bacillota bacterium]|nr:cell wall hydrolase [Bacillota bacterium]
VYPEEDLYWLSRAIYSESGNQPMAGRIAVGTVILNRVADPAFPDTIKDVVFAPRQFSPVANGTIYHAPDERSVVAAKLCLDGVREAEPCLYFNVTTMYSWADRSRTYYCTIGGHNFYL